MGVWSSYGRGRYAPDEHDVVLLPRDHRHDGTVLGVVYCHAAASDALSASDPVGRPGEWTLVRAVAERHPVVLADLGGRSTFGNPTSLARIDDARRYLQGTWGARSGPVALIGVSMGAVGALNYAAANRAHVTAAVGVLPLSDLHEIYTRGGPVDYASMIAAAWGVPVGAALPGGADPTRNTADLVGLPYQAWYASNDHVVPAATVTNLTTLLGVRAEAIDMGALGHSQQAIGSPDVPRILDFLRAHDAAGVG